MSSERFNVPPEAAGDSNQPAGGDASLGGTSTKSKAVKRREQAKRAKARARDAALSAATTAAAKPTLSTFIGDDANLPVLDYTADIAIRYRHFKEEMSRHAGKTDPLMSTVIDEGSEVEAIAEIKKRIAAVEPTPKDPALTEPVEIAKDEARYDMELWEYKTRVGEQIKAVNKFKIECGKFYNVTIGQISQSVEQRLDTVKDFKTKVRNARDLAGLYNSLDEVVLGDKKDTAPFVNALKVLYGAFTTRQPSKQSLPDYNRDFESRLGLLEPKFNDADKDFRNLMSPVLLCAPHFAKELFSKDYGKCSKDEKEEVHRAASNKIKACLFLMLSRNASGSSNSEMLKEKHNQYLGNQDTYPPDMAQAVRQVTDYRPTTVETISGSTFAITGKPSSEPKLKCRLCGKEGYKSPDCPTPSCKAHYAARNKSYNTDLKSSDTGPTTVSSVQQLVDATEEVEEEPLSWIQGMGLHIQGEIVPDGDTVSDPNYANHLAVMAELSERFSGGPPDGSTFVESVSGFVTARANHLALMMELSERFTVSSSVPSSESLSESLSSDDSVQNTGVGNDSVQNTGVRKPFGPDIGILLGIESMEIEAGMSPQLLKLATVLAQKGIKVNPWCLLLDTGSTHHVFSNPRLLSNIRLSDVRLRMKSQGGNKIANEVGDFVGLQDEVWLDPTGPMNVVSFGLIQAQYRVTYDNSRSNSFYIHRPNGSVRVFEMVSTGLYICDLSSQDGFVLNNVASTDPRTKGFSARQIRRATTVDRLRQIMCASEADMKLVAKGQVMPDAGITSEDLHVTKKMFGPSLAGLKGRTTRPQSKPVNPSVEPISPSIVANNSRSKVGIDIMYVNKCRFLVSYCKTLKYGTLHRLMDAKQLTLERCLKEINKVYQRRGLRVSHILADNQFQCLHDCTMGLRIILTIVPSDGHVHEIERFIRLIKERARGLYNTSPFKGKPIPNIMTDGLARTSIFWILAVPRPDSACGNDPPLLVMQGFRASLALHGKFKWGEYVQTVEKSTNTMKQRTVGAIFLHPANCPNGGYYFMSLDTGKRLHRMKATTLPMPAEVITRVAALARLRPSDPYDLEFLDRDRNPIDLPSDANLVEPDDDNDDVVDDDDVISVASDVSANAVPPLDGDNGPNIVPDSGTDDDAGADDNADVDDDNSEDFGNGDDDDIDSASGSIDDGLGSAAGDPRGSPGVDPPDSSDDRDSDLDNEPRVRFDLENTGVDDESTENTGVDESFRPNLLREIQSHNKPGVSNDLSAPMISGGYNLRSRSRGPSSILEGLDVPEDKADVAKAINMYISAQAEPISQLIATVLTQYNLKQGVRLFGDKALAAVKKEMLQLYNRQVLIPRRRRQLTPEQFKKVLEYIMTIKEKNDGAIKGRGCADGRKQREWISKEEASFPTPAPEAVYISAAIDAKEGRDVATLDIPGMFLQTKARPQSLYVVLRGEMLKELLSVAPEFEDFVEIINGRRALYCECDKTLYGSLDSGKLSYLKLSKFLAENGFAPNPFEPCWYNKMVDGHQLSVIVHVDDLKISHKDPGVVSDFINLIDAEYGKEAPLTVKRGKVHIYLGFTIDYTLPGEVCFTMYDFLQKMLNDFPDSDSTFEYVTPASKSLFNINPDADPLDESMSKIFHTLTAKGLFASKRCRPDIQVPIAFLTTRVRKPTTQDWSKLKRLMGYIRATIGIPFILKIDESGKILVYIDGSFAVHQDMRGHTGMITTLGKGAMLSSSGKQKINTRSSTESEIVAVDEGITKPLWLRNLLEAQGQTVDDCILFQDNQASMRLEKNGFQSAGKRTKHFAIRYWFTTDLVKRGVVSIEYCPTLDMVADAMTKPLQGALFQKLRNCIMGIDGKMIAEYNLKARDFLKSRSLLL